MTVVGWFLAVAGVAGVIFALRMMLRLKKLQAVPFRAPSEIARVGRAAADRNGLVSTEGRALIGAQPLFAPMSGQPCLAYRIVIDRKWETYEETENGAQKKTGSERVHSEWKGCRFQLTDGAGEITVDVTEEADAALEASHATTVRVGAVVPPTLQLGRLLVQTPILPKDARTVAFAAEEQVLKPGTLYALGALAGGVVGAPAGLGRKLTLSSRGRSALLAATRRNMMLGYVLGSVLTVGGSALGLLGPAPQSGCRDLRGAAACAGRIYDGEGDNLSWKVDTEGTYKIVLKQPKVKNPTDRAFGPPYLRRGPVDSTLTVFDARGKEVAYSDGGSPGADAIIEHHFAPGTYRLNVRDFARHRVSGGFGYALEVALTDGAPMPRGVGGGG